MVYLVGAGPGDTGLMTVKAAECMQAADVVVYDRLADERILSFAKDGAEFFYVGKAAANHAMSQENINKLLVDLAKKYECVVRLKGGDPFVFGRGGEEALYLEENGIPFAVVPGVTSAIAVPAYAGIPVTHRGIAASFAVITGHEDPTKEKSDIHWEKLVGSVDTLIFLMGVANLEKIAAKLIENGMSGDIPAAIIRRGTRADQQTLTTTLQNAAQDAKKAAIKPPAIFVVGETVRLREKINWFDDAEKRPLWGKRILVTRARAQASALTKKLAALGAQCTEIPAIKFATPTDGYRAIDAALKNIADYDWIIFTSANGAERFFERLFAVTAKDARALFGAKIAAIGTATAKRLRDFGIVADIVPKEFRAEALAEALDGKVKPGERILVARAEKARDVLPEKLGEMGAVTDVAAVYKTVVADVAGDALREKIAGGEFDYITFTSSSTAENLVQIIGAADALNNTRCAAIGPITAETLSKLGAKADIVADEYTIDGLTRTILNHIKK